MKKVFTFLLAGIFLFGLNMVSSQTYYDPSTMSVSQDTNYYVNSQSAGCFQDGYFKASCSPSVTYYKPLNRATNCIDQHYYISETYADSLLSLLNCPSCVSSTMMQSSWGY